MPMTPLQSRRFVAGFVLMLLGLAAVATVSILRGWADAVMRERVEQMEARRQPTRP